MTLTHPCEVKLTTENIQELMKMATELSKNHVEALKEQCNRQGVNYATSA